jgi:hypothetical protein
MQSWVSPYFKQSRPSLARGLSLAEALSRCKWLQSLSVFQIDTIVLQEFPIFSHLWCACSLNLDGRFYSIRQSFHILCVNESVITLVIQRATFSPYPSECEYRSHGMFVFPCIFFQLSELIQRSICDFPFLPTTLSLELRHDLFRGCSEGVDFECLVLRCFGVKQCFDDEFSYTKRCQFILRSSQQLHLLRWCRETDLAFPISNQYRSFLQHIKRSSLMIRRHGTQICGNLCICIWSCNDICIVQPGCFLQSGPDL